MKAEYDLIIVGAGPAGLTAAKVAAENGLSVAVLERKDVIHDILRMCGMMLVTLSADTWENVLFITPKKAFCASPIMALA